MGACSSCLGRNRHETKDLDENDPLLEDSQVFGYGSTASHPDEEELRREREAMDKITSEATEHMIDVVHPNMLEHNDAFPHHGTQRSSRSDRSGQVSGESEAGGDEVSEAAFWQSIQSAGMDNTKIVRTSDRGALAMDLNQLREEPSKTTGKRSSKAAFAF